MTQDRSETPGQEDEFSLWLAACDERLVAGEAARALDQVGVPEALRLELEREVAWCQLVRRIWPHAAPGDRDPKADLPHDRPASPGPSAGELGRFLLRDELGRGSFGVVYLAYDPRLRREVALKVPRAEALVTPELRARFRHEAMAAAGLDHPNIVPVYEAGEEGSVCFIASAYCPGMTLAAWLRRRSGPVPFRVAAALLATLADAVDHAHRRGVLHRDLKPSNVMLEMPAAGVVESASDGSKLVPRITDFGLAKLVDAEPGAAGATQSGVIVGSPSYMAPEQAEGHAGAVGPGADIYSLGVILYEVLTGRPPFQEDSALETLVLVRTQDPLSPSRLRPRLPRDLETICLKCLRRQPQARYPTARALADDLRRFLAAEPIRARPTPAWERAIKWVRRHPALSALAGAACVAAVAVAVVIGVSNVRLQRERDRAEARRLEAVANLRKAREAVDRMLTRVSEVQLKELPQVEPVQRALLEDAQEFYRDFVRQAHDDPEVLLEASQAYRRLGERYATLHWSDEAERCFDEAFALQKKLAAAFPGVPVYRRELAQSYRALSGIWEDVGRQSEAVDALERSFALLDELAAADPSEPGYRNDRAATFAARGQLRGERLGQPREAGADFRKAIDLWDELAVRFPAVLDYSKCAATCRYNLACSMVDDGRLDEAESVLGQVLGYWERMAAGDASNANYRSKMALTLGDLGDVLEKTGRKPEAEQALRRSADLRSMLTKDRPTEPWHFIQLGSMLTRLAKLAALRGDLPAVRRLEEQALSSKRAGLALAPRNPDNLHFQSATTSHAALIETLIGLHEHDDAARAIGELLSFSPDSGPQCFRAGSLLAQCVPLAAADARLTEGRRNELAKTYADRAVELLRKAKERGKQDIEALKSDHGFDGIRSRADFRELLATSVAPVSSH